MRITQAETAILQAISQDYKSRNEIKEATGYSKICIYNIVRIMERMGYASTLKIKCSVNYGRRVTGFKATDLGTSLLTNKTVA